MKARNKDGGGKEDFNCKLCDFKVSNGIAYLLGGSEPEPPLPSCKHIAAEQDG